MPASLVSPLLNRTPVTRREALRRLVLAGAATAVAAAAAPRLLAAAPAGRRFAPPPVTVYKSPTCGCCTAWIEHMEAAGFTCTGVDLPALDDVKAAFGVPAALQSCHTARVGPYLVEGHVPADLVLRLLEERPAGARGLVVPGMPIGSPGMEGGTPERYDVLLLDRSGGTRVYASR